MLESSRSSALYLQPSSLPGRYGMGEIGPEAQHWLTVMSRLGFTDWEMQAVGPTPASGLPLESLSDFAGNPLLISFDALRMDGVLLQQDVAMLPHFNAERVDYSACDEVRMAFLRLAAQRLLTQSTSSPLLGHAFEAFCDREASWLDDWALFAALREENGHKPWREWPSDIAERESMAMANAMVRLDAEVDEHRALQFLFARQWMRLRAQAHTLGLRLVVEVPRQIPAESSDAWACPALLHDEVSPESSDWWVRRLEHHAHRVDALCIHGGPLPAGLLQADYDAPLPILFGDGDSAGVPHVDLRECMMHGAEKDAAPAQCWRFSWDALTSEVEARLAALATTALCHVAAE